ncbi:hypothetical protein FIBSPDRAFT_848151 [Athelia psychrophila]|uniref:Uncharacterized protein n=1 Tax=Athelia psychrophila TaxID=1759441 RepID=A0A166VMQ5_9AGAM|nr:hypothetical protein FIBSPDRAFT_848151 [Fibularhizoctonia sp. CBS 109695]
MPTYLLPPPSPGYATSSPYMHAGGYPQGYSPMPMSTHMQPMYTQQPQIMNGYGTGYYGNDPYYSSSSSGHYGSGHRSHHRHHHHGHHHHRHHSEPQYHYRDYNSASPVYYKHRTVGDRVMGAFGMPQAHIYQLR